MTKFEELHKDIATDIHYSKIKTYKKFNENDTLVEAFEKDTDGNWKDVTLREKTRLLLAAEQKELEKLNAKEMEENEKHDKQE